jgi:hypothetical protein
MVALVQRKTVRCKAYNVVKSKELRLKQILSVLCPTCGAATEARELHNTAEGVDGSQSKA